MGRAPPRGGAAAGANRPTPAPGGPLAGGGHASGARRRRGVLVKEAAPQLFDNSTLDCYAVRNPKADAAPGVRGRECSAGPRAASLDKPRATILPSPATRKYP